MGPPSRRRRNTPKTPKPEPAPGVDREAWVKNASDPENWLTYAQALWQAAHAVDVCWHQLTQNILLPRIGQSSPSGVLDVLPDFDQVFMQSWGPLQRGYTHLMLSAVHSVYWLLAGYALENATKGIRVARTPSSEIENLLSQWRGDRGHRLVQLVRDVGLQVDPSEQDFLKHLTRFTKHLGRYPTPLTMEDEHAYTHDSGNKQILESLWNKLVALFHVEREKRKRE